VVQVNGHPGIKLGIQCNNIGNEKFKTNNETVIGKMEINSETIDIRKQKPSGKKNCICGNK
jgi:hypothetical protein